MSISRSIQSFGQKNMPPGLARAIKRVAVFPRYWRQRARCRTAMRQYGDRYPQKILFIAGLPKSGTTWLESMVASFPGFNEILIPDVTKYELANGESHAYDIPEDTFDRLEGLLAMTKMHVHGSPHNVEVLRRAGVRYIVLYRDLRDVAVSYAYYVSRTPWHPEHELYRPLSDEGRLCLFAERTLPDYVRWVRSWHENRDPDASLELRYEELHADTVGVLRSVARHFQLTDDDDVLEQVVEQHSFSKLSGGRSVGEGDSSSFFRKGTVGDWRTHFTPTVIEAAAPVLTEFLIEYRYERDDTWTHVDATSLDASIP